MKHLCCLFMCLIQLCVANVRRNFDLFEGSYCTEGAQNGTCVIISRCADALRRIKIRQRPQICSFKDLEPVVCCTDCKQIESPRSIILEKDGSLYYTKGQKAYDKCLEYMVSLPYPCDLLHGLYRSWRDDSQCHDYREVIGILALGGKDASRDQYPHMALLGYGAVEDVQWLCGGSVISDKYVLTAAHCISSSLGPVTYVAMGILKRSDPEEKWQRYEVTRIIPYPEYRSPSKYHDIALLETERRIKFNPSVLPACLDSGDSHTMEAYATGWGALGHQRQLADTLQTKALAQGLIDVRSQLGLSPEGTVLPTVEALHSQVELQRFEQADCSKQYPIHRHLQRGYDHASQMCYGDGKKVRDTCEGDSGGPLQVRAALSACMHVIIGVTSYGRSCGVVGNAGIYTRLAYYLPWIERIVWP